jgi:rhodanese-related sulfurtransferase
VPQAERYQEIQGVELYRRLAMGESVVVIDVRTETEYIKRHIPGSMLIPLQELESRMGEVPDGGVPIAATCEEGIRSVAACRLLAEHGFESLYNLAGGLSRWPGPVTTGHDGNGHHRLGITPSSFLVENFGLLPRGLALDLAMGEGRNAIYLATRGFDVDGVEADPRSVAQARAAARKLSTPIRAMVGNVEDGTYIIPLETYDVIIVFNYLYRPVFRDIKDGVVPGGVVVYQAFMQQPGRTAGRSGTEQLLRPQELQEVFADWEILRSREVVGPSRRGHAARAVASLVARKPADD